MATKHLYKCTNCGLEGMVAGGQSALRAGPTKTYYCKTCDTLADQLSDLILPSCENCDGKLIEWNEDQPCPRCKGKIEKDESTIMLAD